MSISSIKGKKFHTSLGPNSSNILDLKIFLTIEEIVKPFLFDSGSYRNYLTMDTFTELCKKSNLPSEMETHFKSSVILANGEEIEFQCMIKMVYLKFEDNFYFNIPFIANDRIHINIIGRRDIPQYIYWVISCKEFYILRRD